MTILGLTLIILAWIYQLVVVWKEPEKSISPVFVGVYLLGTLALALEAYLIEEMEVSAFNIIAGVLALAVFWRLLSFNRFSTKDNNKSNKINDNEDRF
ncbi:MAG: hypothetical protein ACOCU8_01045 [Patescibacteria group bacterium]